MAKGIIGNAVDAAAVVAKTALGAAATAAASVVVQNVARSIAEKSGEPVPPPTPEKPVPEIEMAVRQLLAPPIPRKRPRVTTPKEAKPPKTRRGGAKKKFNAIKARKATAVPKTSRKSRKKR
jgi:hypothetical protein